MNREKENFSAEEKAEKKDAPEVCAADQSSSERLADLIEKCAEGLVYISETDAEIKPFVGQKAESVTAEEVLRQTNNAPDSAVAESDFADFFARLTALQDWFGDEEKANAAKFVALEQSLANNLRELKVFKVGKIQLKIYVLGLDENDKLLGINTQAVET